MYYDQTTFVVTNNENNEENCYRYLGEARARLVELCEEGIDAQLFKAKASRP